MDNSIFVENARKKIKEGWLVDDLIRKLVMLSDSIEKSENTLFEQLNDLYFLYYPEAANILKDRDSFITSLEGACDRTSLGKLLGISDDSMGYDVDEEDIQIVSMSVNEAKNIADLKKFVDERLYSLMGEKYPNLTGVLGPELAARMIYLGKKASLLALMTSSKLQVLGAEKAMFAARRKKATPKYGIIYNHDALMEAPEGLKGKIAKIVASYTSIAIKTDVFSKLDKSKEIKSKMIEAIKRVKNKNGIKKRD
jgi:RNA processing factor Prp31